MAVSWVNSGHPRAQLPPLRPTVLFVVLALHLVTLALLLASSRTLNMVRSTEHSLELTYLAPVKPPEVLVENTRPQRLSTNIAVSRAPPLLTSSLQSGPSTAPDGDGSAVNWTAEAHRAIRAYEIRRDQTTNSALSVSSSLDERGSREHHAGDKSRTASGDWIVWINADCYQVASWHSGATPFGALSSQTICRHPGSPPRGD